MMQINEMVHRLEDVYRLYTICVSIRIPPPHVVDCELT